ncbi:dTDP-4-dehydrorhamnose 3,5-epimerase-like enzyme [Pontibacter aydingkolensis]|uniref:FdtA/QdtA family cupin domain-containing protein n=1 Tax=Pontibacter aydingkolensis TaxID=1911536 RepID=A0ABS7CNM2_9BACT|nr:FdtA/QdtA family cupin domain-containing protein [Pontibacter aydingkolensis]MBW7465459.1 FdtA/QdtA family cupin domain-containing protein [Pontibacter aydingkolensis]
MPQQPYFIQFNSTGNSAEGYISSTQFSDKLPFNVKRVFWTYNTPQEVVRGRHAHIATAQVLVAVNGNIDVKVDNGRGSTETFKLSKPDQGLYLPPMYWANLYFSEGAILLSLTSSDFDEADYIRDYQDFVEKSKNEKV